MTAKERWHALIQTIIETGIIPGIKVDTGEKNIAGPPSEKIIEGLDGLRDRLAQYSRMARGLPSDAR